MRISKFLSSKNIGSRKDIEKLIMEKRISLNGIIITTPITFVSETDLIYLDNKLTLNNIEKSSINTQKIIKQMNKLINNSKSNNSIRLSSKDSKIIIKKILTI